jgi:4-amino-4-deoxy-L-arabinose transferase-like glycosyltransferase
MSSTLKHYQNVLILDRFPTKENLHFTRFMMVYCLLAILALYTTLFIPIMQEEGTYTVSTMEMAYHHNYVITTLFGMFYGRPPMVNWLVLPIAKLIGWPHVVIATRFINVTATVATSFILRFTVKRLSTNASFAWLCTAIFLTGDILLRRGWLAYADAPLMCFTFLAMACLWIAITERKMRLIIVGLLALNCGFLCKALTPFGYYGIFYLVLLWQHPNRRFLFKPTIIILHLIAFSFPIAWDYFTSPQYAAMMAYDFIDTHGFQLTAYIQQILYYQPIMLLLHLSPASFIALYYAYRERAEIATWYEFQLLATIAIFTAMIVFIGCWFAPLWPESRYYMPVYPMFAIALAYVIWHAKNRAQQWLQLMLLVYLAIAFFLGLVGVRWYQTHLLLDFKTIAQDVTVLTRDYPLYVLYPGAGGSESMGSTIDSYRLPMQAPLTIPPNDWNNAFAITSKFPATTMAGQVAVKYKSKAGHSHIYLVCRGTACSIAAQRLGQPIPVIKNASR